MALDVVPWYAAILALIYAGLSVRVIQGRGKYSGKLGSGSVDDLERRVRAQANFAEYGPLTLLLITMEELRGFGRGRFTRSAFVSSSAV